VHAPARYVGGDTLRFLFRRLTAHLLESKAWAIYRDLQKRFASLIGDREPIGIAANFAKLHELRRRQR
jgi:hypothetical protein